MGYSRVLRAYVPEHWQLLYDNTLGLFRRTQGSTPRQLPGQYSGVLRDFQGSASREL